MSPKMFLFIVSIAVLSTSAFSSMAEEMNCETMLEEVEVAVEEARRDADRFVGGAADVIAELRLQTTLLTRDIIRNRCAAEKGSAKLEIIPASKPDRELAAKILGEILSQEKVVKEAEEEAERLGGLAGAVATARLMTEKLALSNLRLRWYQAQYGIEIPAAASKEGVPGRRDARDKDIADDGETTYVTSDVPWADPRHPEIDYADPAFAAFAKDKDATASGWWVIVRSRSKVDDSPQVFAVNVQQAMQPGLKRPILVARCSEGEPSFVVIVDDYLLTDMDYRVPVIVRIDDAPARKEVWSSIVSNEGAGRFGAAGIRIMRDMMGAREVFFRITERNGKRHDLSFPMAGHEEAFAEVARTCGFSLLKIGKDDYRAIQRALKDAGFYMGKIDGKWGRGSRSALRAFQEAKGFEPTGIVDRQTLDALGVKLN